MYITHTKHNLKPLVHLDIAQDAHIDFLCTSLLNKKGKKLRTGIKKKGSKLGHPFHQETPCDEINRAPQ